MEQELDAPKIMSKIEINESNRNSVSKSDGVHTIFLQQSGFSREASLFIQRPSNYLKYVVEIDGNKKIKLSILECGNIGVETEETDIQYNVPELFIE